MKRLLACALALLFAWPAAAATVAVTPATVQAALKAPKGGDVIRLSAETYPGLIALPKGVFDPPVVIDATGATLESGLSSNGAVSGLTIRGGTMSGLVLYSCANVRIENIAFKAPAGTTNRSGVKVQGCDGLKVTGSTFDGFHSAVGLGATTSFTVADNLCTNPTSDCYGVGPGSAHGDFSRNACIATVYLPGAHPDCFQGFNLATFAPIHDITFTGNVGVGVGQCIFVSTKFKRTYPAGTVLYGGRVLAAPEIVPDGGYEAIRLKNNTCLMSFPNGMSLVECIKDCVAENNTVGTAPGATYQARFVLDARVTRCGNTQAAYGTKPAIVDPPCAAPADPAQAKALADALARIADLHARSAP